MEAWLRDKTRSVEERFGAKVIIEKVHRRFLVEQGWRWETDGDEWDPDADFKRHYEDHLDRQKEISERKVYLERLHQLHLRQQDGLPINPADFAPDNVLPVPEQNEDDPSEKDDGDTAVYTEKQSGHPMADALWSLLCVSEKCVWVSHKEQAAVEHLMGRKADHDRED